MAISKTINPGKSTGGNVLSQIEALVRSMQHGESWEAALKAHAAGSKGTAGAVRAVRLGRDVATLYKRAVSKGISPEEAGRTALEMAQRREKQFAARPMGSMPTTGAKGLAKPSYSPVPGSHLKLLAGGWLPAPGQTPPPSSLPVPGGNYGMPTPDAQDWQAREWEAYQKRMGGKAGTGLPVPGKDYGMPKPPTPPAPETSPISAPIDLAEAYRWREVLTREEYQAKFETDRDTSPKTDYEPAQGEAVRILYGPHPCNHEGHLRKTGKPCGHWAMYLFLVGTPDGDHPGVQFKSGYRCYYPQYGESVYHDWLNAESTSYRLWDMHIHGQPYTQF